VCPSIVAKKYHPDALRAEPGSADKQEEHEQHFKRITEAYSVLGDTELRKKYDRLIFGAGSIEETNSDFDNQD